MSPSFLWRQHFRQVTVCFFLDDALSWQTSYILPCAKSEGFWNFWNLFQRVFNILRRNFQKIMPVVEIIPSFDKIWVVPCPYHLTPIISDTICPPNHPSSLEASTSEAHPVCSPCHEVMSDNKLTICAAKTQLLATWNSWMKSDLCADDSHVQKEHGDIIVNIMNFIELP